MSLVLVVRCFLYDYTQKGSNVNKLFEIFLEVNPQLLENKILRLLFLIYINLRDILFNKIKLLLIIFFGKNFF